MVKYSLVRDFEKIVNLRTYFYSFDNNFLSVDDLDAIDYRAYKLNIKLELPKIIDYEDDDEVIYIKEISDLYNSDTDSIYEIYESFEEQIENLYKERKENLLNG